MDTPLSDYIGRTLDARPIAVLHGRHGGLALTAAPADLRFRGMSADDLERVKEHYEHFGLGEEDDTRRDRRRQRRREVRAGAALTASAAVCQFSSPEPASEPVPTGIPSFAAMARPRTEY